MPTTAWVGSANKHKINGQIEYENDQYMICEWKTGEIV